MNKISCVLIDDDPMSQAVVEHLASKSGLLEIRAKFNSADQAIVWLMENDVDLLFLDVEMPGMSGLEMLRSLSYKPDVIIVSAKAEYAAEAFDLSVIDYLVKPVKDYSRFLAAINKVIARRKLSAVLPSTDDSLFVKVDSVLLKLDLNTILWVEAFGDYIKFHTVDKIHTIYSTLKKMEETLDQKKFVRVHRSFIVNVSKITNIDPSNLEINKRIIPISGTYKAIPIELARFALVTA